MRTTKSAKRSRTNPHATRGDFLNLCSATGWYVIKVGQLNRDYLRKVLTLPGNCEVFPDVGGGQYADGSTSWIIPVRSPSTRQRVQDIIRCHFSGWFEVRDMTQAEYDAAI